MKQVRFLRWQDGTEEGSKTVGRVVLDKSEIRFEGLSDGLRKHLQSGIRWRRDVERVFPEDGIKFLEAITLQFGRGSYFCATDVEDVSEEDNNE